jgi:serine/threonine protein kinase
VLSPGDTLAGYRIDAIAGHGGMGVVYRATQLSLDRTVALKVLATTLVGNRTFRERFRREGRHAATLEHPNIIPVYEAGESNGLMFIAMRFVDGPTLSDLMQSRRISGREALRMLSAIASALDAAHEAGLVHRDVKPQNILLTSGGHPYLADFGIRRARRRAA